ncbi:hypothetical protein CXG81DRAFT_26560 [Caulochytrium protostelioides]|uniref:Uncharacterized protein n=1 Tax=Caulochytrium protostelioides TaxID=1555241 RepID=A0A4P9X6D0_9FUNG|nr:hypothetical protein CXG81DRAFT_26560 [Caulochytrium protostelioides]|eukprot:RKP00734.1 hypothetical protein CXG81DRAFT_26560 [Caulochytrium protostelioides]
MASTRRAAPTAGTTPGAGLRPIERPAYTRHTVAGAAGAAGAATAPQLAVNVYPNPAAAADANTVLLLTHANGMHKEMFEPLVKTLYGTSRDSREAAARPQFRASAARRIRAAVAWDLRYQGDTSRGDPIPDAHAWRVPWQVLAGDLAQVVAFIRQTWPQVLICAVGHSVGGNMTLQLALNEPGVFYAVHVVEPILPGDTEASNGGALVMGDVASRRKPAYPSREGLAAHCLKRSFFARWDPECFDMHVQHGFKDGVDADGQPCVVMKTTPDAEAACFRGVGPEGFGGRIERELTQRVSFWAGSESFYHVPDGAPANGSMFTRTLKRFRTVDLRVVPNTNHMLLFEPGVARRLAADIVAHLPGEADADGHPCIADGDCFAAQPPVVAVAAAKL